MLTITHAVRKQLRHQAAPAAQKRSPRILDHSKVTRRLHLDLALRHADATSQPHVGAAPEFQVRPSASNPSNARVQSDQQVRAHRPEYRSGDGQAAIQVCLQHYVVISLEAGNPPALRMHDPHQALPESCCKLPGMLESHLNPGGAMSLQVALQNTVPLQQVPPVLLEAFWNGVSEAMSKEGRSLFAHFNAGLPVPTSATDTYLRLQAYVEWLRLLAD